MKYVRIPIVSINPPAMRQPIAYLDTCRPLKRSQRGYNYRVQGPWEQLWKELCAPGPGGSPSAYAVRLIIQKCPQQGCGGYIGRSECSCEEVLEQIGAQAPIKKNLTLLQTRSGAVFRGYMLLAWLTSAWFSTHIKLINMWPTLRTGWCSNEYLDGSTWSTVSSPYVRKISRWFMVGVRPWRQLDLVSQVQGTVF